jgi:hypothetical protein
MFRLQRRAVAFARIRDVEGVEVPDVRSEHRPPTPFYPSGGLPRHRRENVFKSLRCLGAEPKALRNNPRGPDEDIPCLFAHRAQDGRSWPSLTRSFGPA